METNKPTVWSILEKRIVKGRLIGKNPDINIAYVMAEGSRTKHRVTCDNVFTSPDAARRVLATL